MDWDCCSGAGCWSHSTTSWAQSPVLLRIMPEKDSSDPKTSMWNYHVTQHSRQGLNRVR